MSHVVINHTKLTGKQTFDCDVFLRHCDIESTLIEAPFIRMEYCSGEVTELRAPTIEISSSWLTGRDIVGDSLEASKSRVFFHNAELTAKARFQSSNVQVHILSAPRCGFDRSEFYGSYLFTHQLDAYRAFIRCRLITPQASLADTFIMDSTGSRLPVASATDERGFIFTVTADPWEPRVRAGCRNYSYSEALAHWADTPAEDLVKRLIDQATRASASYARRLKSWKSTLEEKCGEQLTA